MDTNAKLDAAMEYFRRKLTNRIHEIRSTEKLMEPLLQSKGIDTLVSEIEALDILDVATDMTSTHTPKQSTRTSSVKLILASAAHPLLDPKLIQIWTNTTHLPPK